MIERNTAWYRKALAGAVLAGLAAAAPASPIDYQGTLALDTTVTGIVGATGWLDEIAADVDFWLFVVPAVGLSVTIRGTRGDVSLDPVLSVYRGTTTADESAFLAEQDWGGMTFIGEADDEIDVPGGPGGDPLFTSGLLAAGTYTIAIGGFLSDGAGPYAYSLLVSPAAVPEPETIALLAVGAFALASVKRIRRANESTGRTS